jgi:hypothetical protein
LFLSSFIPYCCWFADTFTWSHLATLPYVHLVICTIALRSLRKSVWLSLLARDVGVSLIVSDEPLVLWIPLQSSAESKSDVCQVARNQRAVLLEHMADRLLTRRYASHEIVRVGVQTSEPCRAAVVVDGHIV